MKGERGGFRPLRREQLFQELVHDSYKASGKLAEPTRCPDCGPVFHVWGHVRRLPRRGLDRLFADCLSTSTRYVGMLRKLLSTTQLICVDKTVGDATVVGGLVFTPSQ